MIPTSDFPSVVKRCEKRRPSRLHSVALPLHVDPFDWGQSRNHAWYGDRAALSRYPKLGHGFDHRRHFDHRHVPRDVVYGRKEKRRAT